MRILVTNDDGISSEGLRILVSELRNIAQVTVVVPDREQSAIGTAVTLRQVLRVHKVRPLLPEVETYTIDGTPSDSVILALGKLIKDKIDVVISGINQGMNLGEDTHISGTVGAALQAYLRGFPALAFSAPFRDNQHLDTAAKVATQLTKQVAADSLPHNIFLNVNIPALPLSEIAGVKITRLASESHINTVEEGSRGRDKYYWLIRQRTDKAIDDETDIWAVDQGNISITPLYTNQADGQLRPAFDKLCSELTQELKKC